jgi:biotin operon repressor
MEDLGADPRAIAERFHYKRASSALLKDMRAQEDLRESVGRTSPTVVTLDSVNRGLALDRLDSDSGSDVTPWLNIWDQLAVDSGAAVVLCDHIAKGRDGTDTPIGSQGKFTIVQGALYMVTAGVRFSGGQEGHSRLRCVKDNAGAWTPDSEAAELHVRPSGEGRVECSFEPARSWPSAAPAMGSDGRLRDLILDCLRVNGPMSGTAITKAVGKSRNDVLRLLPTMRDDGFIVNAGSERMPKWELPAEAQPELPTSDPTGSIPVSTGSIPVGLTGTETGIGTVTPPLGGVPVNTGSDQTDTGRTAEDDMTDPEPVSPVALEGPICETEGCNKIATSGFPLCIMCDLLKRGADKRAAEAEATEDEPITEDEHERKDHGKDH